MVLIFHIGFLRLNIIIQKGRGDFKMNLTIELFGLMILSGVATFFITRGLVYLGLKIRNKYHSEEKIKEMDKKFDFRRHVKIASYFFAIFAMLYTWFLYSRLS